MFSIDGVEWGLPCNIERTSVVNDTDISGKLLNGTYFHDVDGTYMRYEITVCPNPHQMGEYYTMYEILTQPVDGHVFVLPYNNDTIEVTGKVEQPRDVYIRMPGGGVYWKGLRFTVTANAPSKYMSLSEVISRGLTPLPDAQSPNVGDTYTFTVNGWESTGEMPDADNIAY